MAFKAGDTVALEIDVRFGGAPVTGVTASYMLVPAGPVPASDSATPPRTAVISLVPTLIPPGIHLSFSGVIPHGIVGGKYTAHLSAQFGVTASSSSFKGFVADDRYSIEVEDDPGTPIIEPVPDAPTMEFP